MGDSFNVSECNGTFGIAWKPMASSPQSYSNHAKFDPRFHFFVAPVFLFTFFATIVRAFRNPTYWNLWSIAMAAAALMAVLLIRVYALKVQDRVIRLEERWRLAELAGDPLRLRISELTESQLIALRFASDAEAPALAQKALNEKLGAKQIKQAIQSWRPDYWRV